MCVLICLGHIYIYIYVHHAYIRSFSALFDESLYNFIVFGESFCEKPGATNAFFINDT